LPCIGGAEPSRDVTAITTPAKEIEQRYVDWLKFAPWCPNHRQNPQHPEDMG
jgi:hypothetical protein